MTKQDDRSMSMLAKALEMESKGREFYEKALKTCKTRLGKELFTKLRDDEIVHQDRIRRIYDSLKGGTPWSDEWRKMKAGGTSLVPLFQDLAKQERAKISAESSDIDALDVGITLEARSIEYYQDHARDASDPLEKSFLEQMVVEEKGHYDTLVDMKFYLTDPDGWFEEKEKIHVDGA